MADGYEHKHLSCLPVTKYIQEHSRRRRKALLCVHFREGILQGKPGIIVWCCYCSQHSLARSYGRRRNKKDVCAQERILWSIRTYPSVRSLFLLQIVTFISHIMQHVTSDGFYNPRILYNHPYVQNPHYVTQPVSGVSTPRSRLEMWVIGAVRKNNKEKGVSKTLNLISAR